MRPGWDANPGPLALIANAQSIEISGRYSSQHNIRCLGCRPDNSNGRALAINAKGSWFESQPGSKMNLKIKLYICKLRTNASTLQILGFKCIHTALCNVQVNYIGEEAVRKSWALDLKVCKTALQMCQHL